MSRKKVWRKWWLAGLASLLVTTGACAGSGTQEATDEEGDTTEVSEALDQGDFVLSFEGSTEDYAEAEQRLIDHGIEEIVDELNEWIALPEDITVRVGTTEGYFFHFDPNVNEIVIGYDTISDDVATLEAYGVEGDEAWSEMLYANQFFLYHEVGHALVHNLELPVTGREEDAVDGFAAFLLDDRFEAGRDLVLSAVNLSYAQAEYRGEELDEGSLADEHSLDEQRAYQYLCWVYGSDTDGYAWIVDEEHLPAERAERCPFEYEQNMNSWSTLLGDQYKPAADQ